MAPDVLFRLPGGRPVTADLVRVATARSSGPGGQNVNRRETKVEVRVRVDDLPLEAAEAALLRERLAARLTREGELVVAAQDARTQELNREAAIRRLAALVLDAISPEEPRLPTRTPRSEREARLADKRRRGDRLRDRRPPSGE